MSLLAVNIGNSNIRYGLINSALEVEMRGILNEKDDSELSGISYDKCCVLSVNSKNEEMFRKRFREMERVVYLSRRKDAFESDYDMNLLGMDRLVNIYFCIKRGLYPAIIADAGTADTYDYIDSSGRHRGGFINAGMDTLSYALSERTDLLPNVKAVFSELALGTNTEEALSKGVYMQWIGGAVSVIKIMRNYDPDASVIITGGNGAAIADFLDGGRIVFDESLTLKGIALYSDEYKD